MSAGNEEFGPYLVYERLGQGGMATVHRAEKRGVGFRRPVALKRLLPHVAADPDLVKLFVDEARLASHLHHANVAQTYELGKIGDIFFIAMEYAPGPTLTQVIRQSQKAAGEIPLPVTVNIVCQICEALEYAHNLCDETGKHLRIIHRDVSPANIIVTNTGLVKLIDFGIAKNELSSVKTQTGFIKGKFGYIAPEYITGKIDKRVDLFAVGVVAHEMLAGRRLFEGKDDFETLANIRDMVMKPPSHWNPHVTSDLDDIVMTALARDPDRRWQSASAMQVALQNAAKEFRLPVGSTQLAEWVEWAFHQKARDTGPVRRAEPHADTLGPSRRSAPPPEDDDDVPLGHTAGSVVSIEVTPAPEPTRRRSGSDGDQTAQLNPRRALSTAADPSGSIETVPVDRVRLSDLATPPRFSRPAITQPPTSPSLHDARATTVDGRPLDDDYVETREVGSIAPPVLRDDTESLDETRQVDVVVPPPRSATDDPIAPPPRPAPRASQEPRAHRETGPREAQARVSKQLASAALPPRTARDTAAPPSRPPRDTAPPPAREPSPQPSPREMAPPRQPSPPPRTQRDTAHPPPPSTREISAQSRATRESPAVRESALQLHTPDLSAAIAHASTMSAAPSAPLANPGSAPMSLTPAPLSLTPTPAPLPSPPLPGLAYARGPNGRPTPTSYDVDLLTPTPIPHTPSRPALPFSSPSRPSRSMDTVELSASSSTLPRLAEASIPPTPPQRGLDAIIVPPGNLFEDPRTESPSGPRAVPPLPGSGPRAVPPLPGSGPRATPPTGGQPVVPASHPSGGQPIHADAVSPTHPTAPTSSRRRIFWMAFWLVLLGTAAMAAAYFFPDLEALVARLTG